MIVRVIGLVLSFSYSRKHRLRLVLGIIHLTGRCLGGNPDHYWQTDRVAAASNAPVVCGKKLARTEADKIFLVDPRGRWLTSWIPIDNAFRRQSKL